MDWKTLVIEIIAAVVAAIGTWVLAKVKTLISTKIADGKSKKLIEAVTDVVASVVKATYQTYVEGIKGTEFWTAEAQKEALTRALNAAKSQMSDEVKKFIEENFGDIDEYLTTKIEAQIYTYKNTVQSTAA